MKNLRTAVAIAALMIAGPAMAGETAYQLAIMREFHALQRQELDIRRRIEAAESFGELQILNQQNEAIVARGNKLQDDYNKALPGGPWHER